MKSLAAGVALLAVFTLAVSFIRGLRQTPQFQLGPIRHLGAQLLRLGHGRRDRRYPVRLGVAPGQGDARAEARGVRHAPRRPGSPGMTR